MNVEEKRLFLENKARKVRKTILDILHNTGGPHIGPSFSIVDILTVLYFDILKVNAENISDKVRDRFVLSKGHACPALYAVLYEKGFIKKEAMDRFAVNGGILQQHPDRNPEHGIELSTGSLGHGLSVGCGMALAAKIAKQKYRTFVLMSDGELNEGSVWEAVMFAGHHKLSNLVAIVDHNKMQALGHTRDIIDLEPLERKWNAFNWNAIDVDGHDIGSIIKAFSELSPVKPNAIILHTTKGKGVSFMENELLWHYRAPDKEEYLKAKKELME
jgi:transketolase